MQACYAKELSGNSIEQVLETQILPEALEASSKRFAVRLFRQTCEHHEEFDAIIRQKAANWEFDRIAVIDKILIRMAICEFLYFDDIPPKVTIDEAIEIAKKFSTENSGRFINGILDAVLADLQRAGRLHKSGRGLSDGRS